VSDGEFARLMARLAPFDDRRHLAVAVSGGPDSLALVLLAARWAKHNGHTVSALTVDHGLRPESAAEARQVADWLAGRELAHAVLRWRGAKPATAVQATARAARYRLLVGWCRRNRVADLLVGHQLEDQAETLLMRLARGTGLDGLAAMTPASRLDGVRLVRPLLAVPKARLRATLEAVDQPWIEDPSNLDPEFLRTRAGQALALLAPDRLLPDRLGVTA
jgi:tRNA(Ile)-lysidine synthase